MRKFHNFNLFIYFLASKISFPEDHKDDMQRLFSIETNKMTEDVTSNKKNQANDHSKTEDSTNKNIVKNDSTRRKKEFIRQTTVGNIFSALEESDVEKLKEIQGSIKTFDR